jgi:hypothetical protein
MANITAWSCSHITPGLQPVMFKKHRVHIQNVLCIFNIDYRNDL